MYNPLESIHESMDVVDKGGKKIGSVAWIKMTDEVPGNHVAEEVTADRTGTEYKPLPDVIVDAFRTDNVPEELREKMLREGFIRIDADGLFAADRYVVPEQIDRVADDKVYLNVERGDLIKHH